jgi:8-oxo-dGTP pyrophosphatase MutT (NUDIX family)
MNYPFDELFRQQVAARCAAFSPVATHDPTRPLKLAAVAVTVVETDDGSGGAAILLTRRAKGLRSHSGQWALPGGRCDASETAVEAALRELNEELGLSLGADDVLGLLDDYPTRSGYLIKPVVAWAGAEAKIQPNPLEVASVHSIPLADIAREDALSFISIPESDRPVIRLQIKDRFVHAPTAAVIYQFLEVLAGRDTRVFDFEQPVFAWK